MENSKTAGASDPMDVWTLVMNKILAEMAPVLNEPASSTRLSEMKNLVSEFAQTSVLPEVWAAILEGKITPGDIPKYRNENYGGKLRSTSDMLRRYGDRFATSDQNFSEAQKQFDAAEKNLRVCQEKRDEARAILNSVRAVSTIKALSRHIGLVFAAGSAWTVLLSIATLPEELDAPSQKKEEAKSVWLRGKLEAYVDSREFLDALRLNLLNFIESFEANSFIPIRAPIKRRFDDFEGIVKNGAAVVFGTNSPGREEAAEPARIARGDDDEHYYGSDLTGL